MRWSTVGGREKKIAVPRCELPSRDSDYSILFGRLEKVRVLHMIQREYLCQVDRLSVGTYHHEDSGLLSSQNLSEKEKEKYTMYIVRL